MKFGVCSLSHVPCRAEAADSSEMVTQLLFGETYQVLEEQEKWVKIQIHHDQYECWICSKQFKEITKDDFDKLNSANPSYCNSIAEIVEKNGQMMPVVLGSNLSGFEKGEMTVGEDTFVFQGGATAPAIKPNKSKIIEDAFMYLGAPYLWGGKSPFGIDCSGFTQVVYRMNGIDIPRDASQQVEKGSNYSFVEEAEPGDLAFFENDEGKITHVGILLDDGKIIHASGKVRIDKLDHHGIYSEESGKYTHKLRIIKNLL